MRHRLGTNTLGGSSDERRRLVRMLVRNFLRSPDMTMVTTRKRADVLGQTIDKLVTHAKKGTTAGMKKVEAIIDDRWLVRQFTDTIIPTLHERTSGYTRRILLQNRSGDFASLARVEWVNKIAAPQKKETAKKEKTIEPKTVKAKRSAKKKEDKAK